MATARSVTPDDYLVDMTSATTLTGISDTVTPAILGVAVVGLALRDVFHTLFHPGGHGGLASLTCRTAWVVSTRLGSRARLLAGPSGVLITVVAWLLLLVAGSTLILLPLVPEGASYASGSPQGSPLVDALYLSAISASTLGLGDVVIQDPSWRWFAPLEGLLGFGVLTAAITWLTQIYPALSRRRGLSLDVWTTLADHGGRPTLQPCAVLRSWATRLAGVTVDIVQNTETFWFRESDTRLSLAPALHRLDVVVATHPDSPEIRQLQRSLKVLRETLQSQYGHHAAPHLEANRE